MHERIVVTGMGTINPLGHNLEESWENVIKGVPGIGPITLFDASDLLVQIACEVKQFEPSDYIPVKDVRRWDRFEHFAMIAAGEALKHSGLEVTEANASRVGVVISSSAGGLGSIVDGADTLREHGPRRLSPFSTAQFMSSGGAGLSSIEFGMQGPSMSVESACASGADGLGVAWLLIRAGYADAMLAGASDAPLVKLGVGGLDRSGAVSRQSPDSPMAPQPFDLNRDGLVMGEGAAVLVLERESFARARGATIYAELAGYGVSADAFHITAPVEDGSGAARAMAMALESAQLNIEDVDYINAHGTGTRLNDVTETRAIKSVFGQRAYQIPVSSTKSMTGHMIGVTPAIEAIFSVKTIVENIIPPTIHYQTPDPDCDLDYVPNEARDQSVQVVMSNSFGFGGHNAVLVVREYN